MLFAKHWHSVNIKRDVHPKAFFLIVYPLYLFLLNHKFDYFLYLYLSNHTFDYFDWVLYWITEFVLNIVIYSTVNYNINNGINNGNIIILLYAWALSCKYFRKSSSGKPFSSNRCAAVFWRNVDSFSSCYCERMYFPTANSILRLTLQYVYIFRVTVLTCFCVLVLH